MSYNVNDLGALFFSELKKYNSTNFKTLSTINVVDASDGVVHKAFSSVVTRFFIFKEKHPELTIKDIRVLYFKLGIDLIAQYFSEYPEGDVTLLEPFLTKLSSYAMRMDEGENNDGQSA